MQQILLPVGLLVVAGVFLTGTFRFWLVRLKGKAAPAAVATVLSAAALAGFYFAAIKVQETKDKESGPPPLSWIAPPAKGPSFLRG